MDSSMKNCSSMTPQSHRKRIKGSDRERGNDAEDTVVYIKFPDDLIEKIISFMPTKPAVSFSVLSTRFKKSWRYSRHLCFDKDCARDQGSVTRIEIINHILDLHLGKNIQKFSLYIDPIGYEGLVEDLIEKVMLRGVEELDLDFSENRYEMFNLRTNFLNVESIRVLSLNHCILDFPPKFKGLGALRTLILEDIGHNLSKIIKTLLSVCLLLDRLELLNCLHHDLTVIAPNLRDFKVSFVRGFFRFSSISIDAPTLSSFHYHGEVCKIKFHSKMAHLNDVILNFTPSRSFKRLCEMKHFMTSLASVNVLTVSGAFLEELSQKFMNMQLRETPFSLWNLKEFHLCIGRPSFVNLFDIASFLKSCPSLESLFIDIGDFSFGNGIYWECHGKLNFWKCEPGFQRLKYVKLKGLKREMLVLEMLKFFLKKARFLETLILISSEKCHQTYFENQCQSFLPASSVARIEVYSHLDDESSKNPTHMKDWWR